MQIGRRFGTFRDKTKSSDVLNWDYDILLQEFYNVKRIATRSSSSFPITDLNFGMSSPYQYSSYMINLPDNKLGTWFQTTINGNDRVLQWTILYPMENRFEFTDLVINYNTAYSSITWLWEDGKIYRVSFQDKKLYRFNPNGTGLEYLVTIETPNNATSGITRMAGGLVNGKMYFSNVNQSTSYFSYVDMETFETWKGTIPNSLAYLMNILALPNGNFLQFNIYGNIIVLNPSFSQVYSANAGSYVSTGFSNSSLFAGMENWIYTGFANHGTSVIAYNYVTNTTKTTTHYKPSYENNWSTMGKLLPTGEIFTWMQLYGSNNGLGGNGAVIYDCTNDNLQICIPSDGSTIQRPYSSKLMSNGKLFLSLNYDSVGHYKLVDLGLNTSFSYSFLTSPWFGGGNS